MLSTPEALKELNEKDSAKILVISDSHGRKENLSHALELYGKSCDALCFLGDGAEDLLSLVEDNSYIPQDISIIPAVVTLVRGNGDNSHYKYFTDEIHTIEIPVQATLEVCGKKIFLTHGHNFDVYYSTHHLMSYIKENGFNAALFGHTHVPYQEREENYLLLNPGSCSLPRNHSDKCCVILTVQKETPEISYQFYQL